MKKIGVKGYVVLHRLIEYFFEQYDGDLGYPVGRNPIWLVSF